MTRKLLYLGVLTAAAGALPAACDQPAARSLAPTAPTALTADLAPSDAAGIPDNVTVLFGHEELGSPFTGTPTDLHDMSVRAKASIYPREVVIRQGGSVTFEVDPKHQVAIYAPGKTPADVDTSAYEPIGPFNPGRIIDTVGRVYLGHPQELIEHEETTPPGTFDQPGRYLIICTTWVHFVNGKMYGWVTVQ